MFKMGPRCRCDDPQWKDFFDIRRFTGTDLICKSKERCLMWGVETLVDKVEILMQVGDDM